MPPPLAITVIEVTAIALRMLTNSYMTILAFTSVTFYIRLKIERMRDRKFSICTKLIIFSIYLLLFLRITNHIFINLLIIYRIIETQQ